jgi:dTDP-4-dehydrorhamnose reductase
MNGKKILITGANGMLGSQLIQELPNAVGYSSKDLDVTNAPQVQRTINNVDPDIIIHTAAFTDVESCENEVDKAFEVNTIGTQNIVNHCIDRDVLFIYISSSGVYGSHKTDRYTEFDKVDPPTIHHRSKYEAEKIVKNHLKKYLILRTGWVFGGDTSHSKNFVYKRYLEGKNNNLVYSNDAQIGSPTYVVDLVEQIKILINSGQLGTYNCVNDAKDISRYCYVRKIIELFELDCKVKKAPENTFRRRAPASNNESAINYKLDLLKINCMGSWDEALQRYIDTLKKSI